MRFHCPYLGSEVELTSEREQHIVQAHPDLLPDHRDRIGETLADPDQVRRSNRSLNARSFTRWSGTIKGGKHVVVVVIEDQPVGRRWFVTSYLARRISGGQVEWQRD
jgi:hypothetical protein